MCARTSFFPEIMLQYESLKVDRNGAKSKKSKIIFVESSVKDVHGFIKSRFPIKGKVILTVQFIMSFLRERVARKVALGAQIQRIWALPTR